MPSAALISWDQDIRSGLLHCLVEPDPAGRRKARAIPWGEEDSTAAALDPFQADANESGTCLLWQSPDCRPSPHPDPLRAGSDGLLPVLLPVRCGPPRLSVAVEQATD